MEKDTDSAAMLPNGESLASDRIFGPPVYFMGVAHEEAGPREVEGMVQWSTVDSDLLGKRSLAGENQRDVNLLFDTRRGEEFVTPDGASDVMLVAFDYDFMRKLLKRDQAAEAELLKIAESNPKRKIRYEIHGGWNC